MHLNDIEHLDPRFESLPLLAKLRGELHRYHQAGKRAPLARAIFATYRIRLALAWIAHFVYANAVLWFFVIFRTLGRYLTRCYNARRDGRDSANEESFGKGVGIIMGASLTYLAIMLIRVHVEYITSVVGGQLRTMMGVLMYEKSFVISPAATRKLASTEKPGRHAQEKEDRFNLRGNEKSDSDDAYWSRGAMLCSMSIDADRIEQLIATSSHMIGFIAAFPSVLILGWLLMGRAGLVASAVVIALTPPVVHMIWILTHERQKINALTQLRIDLFNDMLQGIRFLK